MVWNHPQFLDRYLVLLQHLRLSGSYGLSTYIMSISICNSWLLLQVLLFWSFWEICHSWFLYHILFLTICRYSLTPTNCWLLYPSLLCTISWTRHSQLLWLHCIFTRQILFLWLFQPTRSSWKSKSHLVVKDIYSNSLWQVRWLLPIELKTQILGI